jgi:RND family efflux transporter MFP subunit
MLRRKLILVPAMLLSAAACGNDKAGGLQGAPPEVTVEPPRVETVTDWSVYTGRFEAIEEVDVRARVSGYLNEVQFEDGADVKKGDLLFTIDRRPFEAALAAAQGELAETKATLAQARKERARAEQLIEIGGVSQEELDALAAAAARAEAALEAAKARVRSADLDVEFTEVRAPISGRISERRIDPGNLIASGAGADILTTIVSDDPIHFVFEVSESDVLAYLTGQRRSDAAEIEIKLLGEKDYSRRGKVTFADNRVDPGSGTLKLRATIDNADRVLRPGFFGEARVSAFESYQALTVPETAIVSDASRRLVYVIGAENKVEPRAVELGPIEGSGRRIVRSGLQRNDRVIVSGLQRARPGAPVQPVEKGDEGPSKLAADGESRQ